MTLLLDLCMIMNHLSHARNKSVCIANYIRYHQDSSQYDTVAENLFVITYHSIASFILNCDKVPFTTFWCIEWCTCANANDIPGIPRIPSSPDGTVRFDMDSIASMKHGASYWRPDFSFDTSKPTISCSNQKCRINVIIMHSQMTVGNSYSIITSISTRYDVNNPSKRNRLKSCTKTTMVVSGKC